MSNRIALIFAAVLLSASFIVPKIALAADARLECDMKFATSGWSIIYKTASGTGTITCNDGSRLKVNIKTTGGGLTVGKSSIDDGRGKFSNAHSINELLGDYVTAGASAGAVKSSEAQAMTKGEISLAISGTGRGWDLGVAFGKFTISPMR